MSGTVVSPTRGVLLRRADGLHLPEAFGRAGGGVRAKPRGAEGLLLPAPGPRPVLASVRPRAPGLPRCQCLRSWVLIWILPSIFYKCFLNVSWLPSWIYSSLKAGAASAANVACSILAGMLPTLRNPSCLESHPCNTAFPTHVSSTACVSIWRTTHRPVPCLHPSSPQISPEPCVST
eukprot:XP_022275834.1 cell death-inducing p53-target protein 1 isoform X2 [Canis lupus familiaris]